MIRAAARRAATIFQPPMLPDRSSTSTTSRGRPAGASAGGSTVSANVPSPLPSASGTTASEAVSDSAVPSPNRSRKSRSARSPGLSRTTSRSPICSSVTTCRLDRTAPRVSPAGSSSIWAESGTGFGKPGSSTGGVIRDASGTASVSGAVPSPTGWLGREAPGM